MDQVDMFKIYSNSIGLCVKKLSKNYTKWLISIYKERDSLISWGIITLDECQLV